MIQSILCPIDLDKGKFNALDYAVSLAKRTGATLTFFFVLDPHSERLEVDLSEKNDVVGEYDQMALRLLEKYVQDYKEVRDTALSKVKLSLRAGIGGLTHQLKQVLSEEQPGLMVWGFKKLLRYKEFLVGQDDLKFLHEINIPVLIVPPNMPLKPFQPAIFATDLQTVSENTLSAVDALCQTLQIKMELVHVKSNAKPLSAAAITHKAQFLQLDCTSNYVELVHTEVVAAILEHTEKTGSNLLGTFTHHRSWWEKFFTESTTMKIANKTPIPMLIFPLFK